MKARAAGALTAATALVAGVLTAVVVQAGPAAAAAPVGSRYTAVTPTRVLDTRIGLGVAKTRVAPGTRITFDVSSVVPATATSVVLNLTVAGETAPGFVTAYGAGTTQPGVSNLNYVRAQTVPNLAVVTFGSSREVTLYNAGGTVDLLADVSGYYLPASAVSTPPSGTDQGAFVGVQPKRVADTRTSTPLAARTSRSFTVPGLPVDASAVLVNITATGSRTGGYLTAYSGDSLVVPGTSTVNFPAGRTVPNAALVPLGTGNRINVYNASAGATNVLLDIQGYLVNGDPTVAGGTGILRPTRVLAAHEVRPRSAIQLKVAGAAGVPAMPLTDVPAAVPLNVTVTRPSAGGYLSVSASKAAPSFSNLNFAAGQTVANFVQAPVAADGTTTFYNGSAGTVYVLADVLGYVAGATHPAPAVTTSRYLADLTGVPDKDAAIMKAHGTADAASGADFVLLDVGAQSLHSPLPASGGVALALSGTPGKPVRLPYIDLVDAVKAYADAYAKAADGPVRIAVGTSNSGNFTDSSDPDNPIYPATARGTDWADQVVDPLQAQAPSGVTIVGANDIENGDPNQDGFDNSVTRAQQWEAAWFAATSTKLIYNGSANGCPTTYGGTGTCNDGWTQQQFYDLARGTGANAGRVEVLPQIYYSTQAIQWANIDRAGGGGLTFVGALTQYSLDPSTFTPTAGWAALRHALSTYRTPPADLRSVDITYGSTQPAASSARDLERERGVA